MIPVRTDTGKTKYPTGPILFRLNRKEAFNYIAKMLEEGASPEKIEEILSKWAGHEERLELLEDLKGEKL